MKKIVFIMAVIGTLAISSCKKNWTCQCTDNNSAETYHEIDNATIHDADKTCASFEFNDNNGSYNNCSIIE